ncbi:hypothetical protein EES39_19875 [Streptomyces sp. ADI92-24]|nr:hypothetical protein EES39_19875 [Streptomyces sp. ADI92-24]
MRSAPSVTACQRSSGEPTLPGYRHAMPTMTIGSSVCAAEFGLTAARAAVAGAPATSFSRWRARATGVG